MDASDTALGTVLQQQQDGQLRVIGYASRALTNAERHYCITRKELLGVVYGLKKYVSICWDGKSSSARIMQRLHFSKTHRNP